MFFIKLLPLLWTEFEHLVFQPRIQELVKAKR